VCMCVCVFGRVRGRARMCVYVPVCVHRQYAPKMRCVYAMCMYSAYYIQWIRERERDTHTDREKKKERKEERERKRREEREERRERERERESYERATRELRESYEGVGT